MFKFQAVVTDGDEIPEEYRELYDEQDGVFVLKTDLIKDHPAIKTVKGTADKLDKDKRALAKKIKELETKLGRIPEDFDPDRYQEMVDELESLRETADDPGNADPDDKKKLPSRIKTLEGKLARAAAEAETEIKKRDDRITKLSGQIKKLLIDEGLTKALAAAGIDAKYIRAAKALLRDQVSLTGDEDEYEAVVETAEGDSIALSKYVADWAASDEGKAFVTPASGGGADPGHGRNEQQGVNPFKKETFNLTEQGRLIKEDPAKARRFAKQAGWSEQKIAQRIP